MNASNHFNIIGNLTKDVVIKTTTNGAMAATYIVAVNEEFYDRDGKLQKEVDYIPVTSYGKQAENDAKYLKKGSGVAVLGRIRSWYNREERKGGMLFMARSVKYLSRPGAGSENLEQAEQQCTAPAEHDDWLDEYDRASLVEPR